MAEQPRQWSAKPSRRVQLPHGTPFFPSESGAPGETTHGRSKGAGNKLRWQDRAGFLARDKARVRRISAGICNERATPSLGKRPSEIATAICCRLLMAGCRIQCAWETPFASVVKLQSYSASNGEFAGESPAGCTNPFKGAQAGGGRTRPTVSLRYIFPGMWLNPNSRESRLRIW